MKNILIKKMVCKDFFCKGTCACACLVKVFVLVGFWSCCFLFSFLWSRAANVEAVTSEMIIHVGNSGAEEEGVIMGFAVGVGDGVDDKLGEGPN